MRDGIIFVMGLKLSHVFLLSGSVGAGVEAEEGGVLGYGFG